MKSASYDSDMTTSCEHCSSLIDTSKYPYVRPRSAWIEVWDGRQYGIIKWGFESRCRGCRLVARIMTQVIVCNSLRKFGIKSMRRCEDDWIERFSIRKFWYLSREED